MYGLIFFIIGCGVGHFEKKIGQEEFDHWRALRIYMDEGTQKEFRKFKTREERDQYLKDKGLWEKFYQYEPHIRDQIAGGDVKTGWSEDMLFMAWGQPYDREKIFGRNAQESYRLTYRFEELEDGAILVWEPKSKTQYKAVRLFQKEVYIDDGKITELKTIDLSF